MSHGMVGVLSRDRVDLVGPCGGWSPPLLCLSVCLSVCLCASIYLCLYLCLSPSLSELERKGYGGLGIRIKVLLLLGGKVHAHADRRR